MKMMRAVVLGLFSLWSFSVWAVTAVYVPNFDSDDVSVIDITTNTVTNTIPVGNGPFTLITSLDATKVYVGNFSEDTVSVIDARTETVINTLTVGASPEFFAITPNGQKIYVSNAGANSVSVIDVATDTVLTTIPLPVPYPKTPLALEVAPNGQRVYVPNQDGASVTVIDVATDTIITTIGGLGSAPQFVAFTPDSSLAYVSSKTALDNIAIINNALAIPALSVIIASGNSPEELIYLNTVNGAKIYAPNSIQTLGFNTVTIIDVATNATALINVGTGIVSSPELIAATPNGSLLFVPLNNENAVAVISTATNTQIAQIPVGTGPRGVAVSADGRFAYVSNVTDGTVSVIDVATFTVIATVPVGNSPLFLDFATNLIVGTIAVRADGCGKDSFLSQVDLYAAIRWSYPQWAALFLSAPTEYLIYRDNVLVGTVRADKPLIFEDHNRKPNRVHNYTVVAKDDSGFVAIGTATIKTCKE